MEAKELLQRFDSRSRLLLQSLLLRSNGVSKALKVLSRLRTSICNFSLHGILDRLCQQEPCVDSNSQGLTTKPLVCLFPASFQWNLLSFLHLVHKALPKDCTLSLLDCLGQDWTVAPWTATLVGQLRRDLTGELRHNMLSPQCKQNVRELCKEFRGTGRSQGGAGGWAAYYTKPEPSQTDSRTSSTPSSQSQKRKSETLEWYSDPGDEGKQSKRMRMEVSGSAEVAASEEASGRQGSSAEESSPTLQDQTPVDEDGGVVTPPPQDSKAVLPDHIKAAVPLIKELLEIEMEWDQSAVATLGVLNECDPSQVDVLWGLLQLREAPEQTLPQFCSCLLAVSPDLSHSVAAALIRNLLLNKVLSLCEPASRWLSSAVSSVCARYPRPMCQELIRPVLEGAQAETVQIELICRLIEDSLEPQYRLLVFGMTLNLTWNENILTIIHSLLDKKLALTDEMFTQFTNQLSNQSPNFVKSMKFAKMLLTVLTKYPNHVKGECKHTLSCCSDSNGTFLKKSLQAALKRIP